MTEREQERMDNLILSETELGGVMRLVVPPELATRDRSTWSAYAKPGVWLIARGTGRSPCAHPYCEGRLLEPDEALALASALDAVARPRSHSSLGGDSYPATYVEFLTRWYSILGERLHVAIESAENRRTELRELRAALTGSVAA